MRAIVEKIIFRWNKFPLIIRCVFAGALIVALYNWAKSFQLQKHYPFCPSYSVPPVSYSDNLKENGIRQVMSPPTEIPRRYLHVLKVIQESIRSKEKNRPSNDKILQIVSGIVQEQLSILQTPEDCNVANILCGHHKACGLGCQIHHRVACVAASYALGMPLIHDEKHWSYANKWNDIFLPLGSSCRPGNETYRLQWKENTTIMKLDESCDTIEFPLKNGFVAFGELADIVESSHTFPFMWWFGQFMKFGVQLNEEQQYMLQIAKKELKFLHPIVGIHVRRTDNSPLESEKTIQPISFYMKKAKYLYTHRLKKSTTKNVFISSDDAKILDETKQIFLKSENWNIIGFKNRTTYRDEISRRAALKDIVTDLFVLSECDFVVCGFSSNICRLVLGMLNYKHFDGMNRLDGSLDGNYVAKFSRRIPTSVVKVCE